MRPTSNPTELFGHRDVIKDLKQEFAATLSRAHNTMSFDRVEAYADTLRVDIPKLGEPRTRETREGKFPAGNEAFIRDCSRDTLIPGYNFTLEIPFTGDSRVFEHMPSRWVLSGRQTGRIKDSAICADFYVLESDPETMKQTAEQAREEIKSRITKWFELAVADFERWNNGLEAFIENGISVRKEEITKDSQIRQTINEITES